MHLCPPSTYKLSGAWSGRVLLVYSAVNPKLDVRSRRYFFFLPRTNEETLWGFFFFFFWLFSTELKVLVYVGEWKWQVIGAQVKVGIGTVH